MFRKKTPNPLCGTHTIVYTYHRSADVFDAWCSGSDAFQVQKALDSQIQSEIRKDSQPSPFDSAINVDVETWLIEAIIVEPTEDSGFMLVRIV